MINLLPDETKKQLRAGRANILMIKFIILLGIAVVFLSLACVAVYIFLASNKAANENSAKTGQTNNLTTSVNQQAETLRTNLASVKSVLDQQISYSKIIMGIGAVLPIGTVLDTLVLNSDSLNSPITLSVKAKLNSDEPKLKANFDKNNLFSGYKLGTIKTDATDISGYPITISISVTINKGLAQ